MILHGNQRGGAKDLAQHLMKEENERVQIHAIRGFVSDNLEGAFQESYAISRGTRCKQHLYSLSINPPADANIKEEHFIDAADRVEQQLGLKGQPRAIVFHDKRGRDGELRRHAHAVWCRIDPQTMTAKQISFDKEKLREVSRDLHIKHDLKMPAGLVNSKERNPSNFTLAEWQQCKRAEKDPKQVKSVFQDCWAISDSKTAFAHALKERGYVLAQGRRGHVAVDFKGEKYAVSRYVGIKAKEVRARLGEADGLPSIEKAQQQAARQITDRLKELKTQQQREIESKQKQETQQTEALKEQHAWQKQRQKNMQQQRWDQEEQARKAKIRSGLWGVWDRVTGQRKKTELQNEQDVQKTRERDKQQILQLETQQRKTSDALKDRFQSARQDNETAIDELSSDIKDLKSQSLDSEKQNKSNYAGEQRRKVEQAKQNRARAGPKLER